jgi:Tol biopolymer transport system component
MNRFLRRGAILVTSALVSLALAGAVGAAKDDLDLVSVASAPAAAIGNGSSLKPALSADGRFVAFESSATNFNPADADNKDDVYERDLQTGTTTLVSRATGAAGAKGNFDSLNASVSADGRFVAFDSTATNLDPADGDVNQDVFVRDLQTNTTTLVSRTGVDGPVGNAPSSNAAISADGRFVTFESAATNLTPDGTADVQVFVRDLQTNTTTLVSRATDAGGALADGLSSNPAISADGRFVAFSSRATNLDPAEAAVPELGNVFVRDLQTNTTTLVSRATGAAGADGNRDSGQAAISSDGRFVAFVSFASNLTPDAAGGNGEIFVRDRQQNTTALVSRATGAAGAEGDSDSTQPTISSDGRFVAFMTNASNLDPADGTTAGNIIERDRQANATTLISRAAGTAGAKASFFSTSPAISADGQFVAFASAALNLVPGGSNGFAQVFRRDVLGPAEPPALMAISDASLAEGNAGQTAFRFTVSLDRPESDPVTVRFTTANGTATAPADYATANGTITFAPGQTTQTVTVLVNGDTTVEPDETFTVNLDSPLGKVTIADPQGVGTIRNDDQPATPPPPPPPPPPAPARIAIADVRHPEGNSGRTRFRFRVSLDRTEGAQVSVAFSTGNRTARTPLDYAAVRGVVTFAPGETSQTITVLVRGDTTKESNETFRLDLAHPAGNATIADGDAIGTIVNDDRRRARQPSSARPR